MKMGRVFKLVAVLLVLSLSQMTIPLTEAGSTNYPSAETQALFSSLSPPKPSIGDDVTWLVWTDPNATGQEVTLEVVDVTNGTTVYGPVSRSLGTLNRCGSLKETVSTEGYLKHRYQFSVTMSIGNMEIKSYKYLDWAAPAFILWAWVESYKLLRGEAVNLTIQESIWPYVDATANITVYNATHPALWTTTGVTIPATTGTSSILIPTTGLSTNSTVQYFDTYGSIPGYGINVTATSAIGTASSDPAYFVLSDLILEVKSVWGEVYVGDLLNVSIRTHATVPQAGLKVFFTDYSVWPPTIEVVVDEYVSLTNGEALESYDTSGWKPAFSYIILCNATVDTTTVQEMTFFSLMAFRAEVGFDKFIYHAGESVNATVSTHRPQPSAPFNLTVYKGWYEGEVFWSVKSLTLDSNGRKSVMIPTNETWSPSSYGVEVRFGEYSLGNYFTIWAFDILAEVSPSENVEYAMPTLNVTTVPGQTSNLTFTVTGYPYPGGGLVADYYSFKKTNFDVSSYQYVLPLAGMLNVSCWVSVTVDSAVGTNSTMSAEFLYSHGVDTDGDGLSDAEELSRGTSANYPDTDGDGFFDGIEVFYGSDPNDPASVIPEFNLLQLLVVLGLVPAFLYIAIRKRRIGHYQKWR